MDVVGQDKALTMKWCLDCHRDPDIHLRPRKLVTRLDWIPEGDPLEQGQALRETHKIEPSTDCSVCHR